MMMFFETVGCPDGWKQAAPRRAALWSGSPRRPGRRPLRGSSPSSRPRCAPTPTATDATLVTSPHGIALSGGCCASGSAEGMYESMQDTGESEPGLPYRDPAAMSEAVRRGRAPAFPGGEDSFISAIEKAKRLPSPTVLSTVIAPPISSTSCLQMLRPRPVPP